MEKAGLGAVVFLAVSGFLAAASAADEVALPVVGSRVRLRVSGSEPLVGTLTAVDSAHLTLARSGGDAPSVVARRDVTKLERSVRPSGKRKGALIGLAVGFGAGFATAAALGNCSETPGVVEHCGDPVWSSLYGAAAGAAGAGIGALLAPGERWAEVPMGAEPAGPGARTGVIWRVLPLAGPRRGAVLSISW